MKKSKHSKRQRQESIKKTKGCWNVWRKKLKYKGDWVQEVQGTMMLVATVIATVTFQAGINPPGGVWQQDTPYNSSTNINQYPQVFPAGTAIMSSQLNDQIYWAYLNANTLSFLASVSVIMLIISRFPLKNKVCSFLLALTMFAEVFFLTFGYLLGVDMVNSKAKSLEDQKTERTVILIAVSFWLVLVFLIGLYHIIRFLILLLIGVVRFLIGVVSKFNPKASTSPHVQEVELNQCSG